MRKLNRRMLRWQRYAEKTYWNPRVTRPAQSTRSGGMTPRHWAAWAELADEQERRRCRHELTDAGRVVTDLTLEPDDFGGER